MADFDDIINTIIAEAIGEGDEGMRRVGETILNRAAIRGLTPGQVVRQANQYTGYSAPGSGARAEQQNPLSIAAAEAAWALARQPGDPTNGADHYHADYVRPYWANSMPSTGSFGRHTYYSSQPVPENALAALLEPATRDVAFPRSRPQTRQVEMPRERPRSPSDLVAEMFGASFAAPRDAVTGSALDRYVGGQRAANADSLTLPGEVDRYVGGLAQDNFLAAALQRAFAPRSTPAMPTGVTQSYAGQERISPSSVQAIARAFTPATAPQTYAAQDGATSRSAITAASARQAADQLTLRNANQQASDAERNRTVVATVPTSGIGQPPATRTVQSVPVPTQAPKQSTASAAGKNTPLTIGATPSFAGQDRAVASRMTGVDTMPAYGDIAMMFGSTPQAAGSVNNKKGTERLKPNDTWTVADAELAAMHGIVPPPAAQIDNVQVAMPRRRPDTPQNTQVAVTQPPRRAVTPAPVIAPASAYAQPRSTPASSAVSAIARSTDPAGTFRTGTNGYVYSANGNGGYQRVGTSRPAGMSAQQQYDWANALAAERARESAPMSSNLHDRITSGDLWGAHR